MTKQEARQRIEKLKKTINHHRYLYHAFDRQEISQEALDSLKKELFDLEARFPDLVTSDSPTQRVEGRALDKFEKVRHAEPMISLNDAFSETDMKDWVTRILRLLDNEEKKQIDFYCELKIDGLAIELIYENELFKIGSTRGDGKIGEDVTQNLKTIEAIPLKLREKEEVISDLKKQGLSREIVQAVTNHDFKKPVIVRGEVFISKKDFKEINKEQEKAGLAVYANPRNLAAGSVRQLDPKVTISRHLNSFAYELVTDFGQKTHEEKHKILKAFGFKTNSHNKHCVSLKEVFDFHKYIQGMREKIHYEIDGIVVIINSDRIFRKLGVVGKAPRGAVAFKFPLKQASTVVEDIRVQVGRTGALTPVAVLRPVKVSGVVVSRATLHNEDEIERLGLRIGDSVIVGRAGDVIPDIIRVLPELRTGKEKVFRMPKSCSICGSRTERKPGEAATYCTNADCFARQKEYFYHFVSRGGFDVVGLGPKIIDRLIEEGLASDPADLFLLKEGDILPLDRFAEKSARNLVEAIGKKKEITLPRLIYALGIRNVGEETSLALAEHFGSIEKLSRSNLEGLLIVQDIGPIVAKSINDWFSLRKNVKFLEKLKKVEVKVKSLKPASRRGRLEGLVFVLTGALKTMTREKAKERIRGEGGIVSESVSQKTNFIIAGLEAGSKLEKAKKTSTKILTEREFIEMIK